MSTARRHHYIPRLYLKGFSKPRKRGREHYVHVYERGGRTYQSNITGVAVENDFNTVSIDGHPPDAFEKGMAAFEAEVAPALMRLLETGRFRDDEDRILVMNLIGAMAIRNPRLRELWRDFHERVSYVILDILTADKGRWERHLEKMKRDGYDPGREVPYDNVRKMVAEKEFKLELQNEAHIKMEVHSLDTVLPLLVGRKWVILRAPSASPGFLTSDDPVCLTLDDPEFRGGLYRPGFGLRNTSVTVPLARHLAIVGKFEGEERCMTISEKGVAHVKFDCDWAFG